MNEIMNFEHAAFGQVRTLNKDGEPWFVAKDICTVLGYTNTRKAVIDHCKSPILLKSNESLPLNIPPRGLTIIPERDVYRLIMRSNLPQAEQFEEWVVGEVLPAIRKHGGYVHATTEETSEEIIGKTLHALL